MGHAPVDPSTLPFPDNKIRAVLKQDWQVSRSLFLASICIFLRTLFQVVVGILGLYAGLILFGKVVAGGKKDAPVAVPQIAGAFPASGYKSGVGDPSFTYQSTANAPSCHTSDKVICLVSGGARRSGRPLHH